MLVQHRSDALAEVLRDMLKFSTNMTAEVLGLSASGAGSLGASGKAMSDWAAGRYGLGARFVDHSGLGAGSRISARDMVTALLAARGTALPGVLREIGMRDAKGKVIEGHPVRVIGKTGTLNFVSGLAGYVLPPSGRDLVFAVFCADADRRDRLPMSQREEPEGGRDWTKRARLLQAKLVSRWAGVYG
ncbi:D-alanyl-D-alanine carboxypeptidase/D-alanyl-D-alanine-endopeptidase [Rhodobacter ferrooxidans]|uniref:D-alanyl-D-alanine carboxypeptidase/D-alanyl-D-alanine-endopeptidase n=1 Tax=Rhodobacter ferrooxidans TaxID=371731 RepID=C8S2V7_9RHOB|nr:D-alanyl-D-alanine carboxypeptidase/D-alanyl-D-alanine-endopeptidase [Rhodobacter sp. SW2]